MTNEELIDKIIEHFNKTGKLDKKLFDEIMKRDLYIELIKRFPENYFISSKGNVFTCVPGHNRKSLEKRRKAADFMESMFEEEGE